MQGKRSTITGGNLLCSERQIQIYSHIAKKNRFINLMAPETSFHGMRVFMQG